MVPRDDDQVCGLDVGLGQHRVQHGEDNVDVGPNRNG
jgi:hypothetical protein